MVGAGGEWASRDCGAFLVDMSPRFSKYNFANHCLPYVKHISNALLAVISARVKFTDLSHFFIIQFRQRLHGSPSMRFWMPFRPTAFTRSGASFSVSIGSVFLISSEPQVVGINANPIVAFMAYAEPVRNWAESDDPRNSVRFQVQSVKPNPSVPAHLARELPYPTRPYGRNDYRPVPVNSIPKFLLEGVRKELLGLLALCSGVLHSISSVDCLPRLRLFVQRAGNLFTCISRIGQLPF